MQSGLIAFFVSRHTARPRRRGPGCARSRAGPNRCRALAVARLTARPSSPGRPAIRFLGKVAVAEPSRDQVSLTKSKQRVAFHRDRRWGVTLRQL